MTGWFWGFNVGNYPSTIEHISNVLKELMLFFKQKMAQESQREEVLNDEENGAGTRCHRPIIVDLGIFGKKSKGNRFEVILPFISD